MSAEQTVIVGLRPRGSGQLVLAECSQCASNPSFTGPARVAAVGHLQSLAEVACVGVYVGHPTVAQVGRASPVNGCANIACIHNAMKIDLKLIEPRRRK
jgi:hypothetical protein